MNDRPTNPVTNPQMQAGILEAFARQDRQAAERREAETAERRREELERQASYTAAVRQTLAAFGGR
jgi:hypothetical protein